MKQSRLSDINHQDNSPRTTKSSRMQVDEDEALDESQLEEYGEMLDDVGTVAEKVKVNTLTMIAEDYADSPKDASKLCRLIHYRLVSTKVRADHKLPLVYVVDSILKNVQGTYVTLMENDIMEWMPIVAAALPEHDERKGRPKLKKVWMLWKDSGIFSLDVWQKLGQCFISSSMNEGDGSAGQINPVLKAAGIDFGKNGNLILMPSLREAMQSMLDELQEDVDDLDKVSLERLAAIDADLLVKIKTGAEDAIRNTGGGGRTKRLSDDSKSSELNELSFLIETRSRSAVATSKTWEKLNEDQIVKDANTVIAGLNRTVRHGTQPDKRYTQSESVDVMGALATAAVTASLLAATLQDIKNYQDNKARNLKMAADGGGSNGMAGVGQGHAAPTTLIVDKNLFTSEGVKQLNLAIVGLLYEVGLPFSLNDGYRFATEVELAGHIDRKFKAANAQKSIAASHERGWYDSDEAWTGQQMVDDTNNDLFGNTSLDNQGGHADGSGSNNNVDPQTLTFPADETRDKCVVCGINFNMVFDSEDGIYKFKNCREIAVLTADGDGEVEMLIHGTCWKSLACPDVLSHNQASNEVMNEILI